VSGIHDFILALHVVLLVLTSSSAPTQDKPADFVCRGQLIFAIVGAHAGVAREGGRCAGDVKGISMSPYVRAKSVLIASSVCPAYIDPTSWGRSSAGRRA
jgi:hypothetical protein